MQLKEASILLVDDEPILLEIMAEWFQRLAGRVFCAADGAQALQVLAARKIDLVITDVRMPVMDGISLLKEIKAKRGHAPGVILVTGFADIQLRDAFDSGAEALLEKPIENDDLIRAVERSLLERDELWQTPRGVSAYPVLSRKFASLAAAFEQHRIAFGRGGFCIEAGDLPEEGPVNIELDFIADGYVLSGQGVVRWLAHKENQAGIELTYVAERSLSRALQLTAAAASFIPSTTESKYQALAG
jgi:CheY-like chemotaxis protein